MFQRNKIDELFLLLEKLTTFKRQDTGFRPSKRMRYTENTLIFTCISTWIALICVTAWLWFSDSSTKNSNILIITYIINLLSAIGYMAVVIIGSLQAIWRHRNNPFSAVLTNLKHDLHTDADPLQRLLTFDKPLLEYGLLQYRQCWESFDNRFTAIAGSIPKLGMIPALAALSLAITELFKQDGGLPVWATLIPAACLYLFTIYTIDRRGRPQQVIKLLEHAINHAEDNSSDAMPLPSDCHQMTQGHMRPEIIGHGPIKRKGARGSKTPARTAPLK